MAYKMVYNPLTGKWDKVWVDESSSSGSGGSSGFQFAYKAACPRGFYSPIFG